MSRITAGLIDWLDDRTGVKKIVDEALYEPVPGGARWRYVWGSTLVMAFVTQIITGTFLWMAYSPSTQTAWESVFYIQYEMPGGWLLRGIHHFMAQAMIVLLALHFVQVVWDGAYRAPRELNFVIGIVLMLIVLGLSFTGYLLPWDQKGYWATSVGTNLASQAPVVGPEIKKLAIGGSDYGHHTLTRFFALHAGVLPGLMVGFIALHVMLFRRHGLHAKNPKGSVDGVFWPDQVLKDSVAALGVLAAVLGLTVYYGGAELTAPADPSNPYDAARPEWYFLFLFQFLKWFPGEAEVWGAFVIPGLVVAVLFVMPWIGRWRVGHFLNVAMLAVLLGGSAILTVQALQEDYYADWYPDATDDPRHEPSTRFLVAKKEAHHVAERVVELAQSPSRIPPTGALTLVYNDAFLQGRKIFEANCASCHPHSPRDAESDAPALAPNLYRVGGADWVAGMLDPERVGGKHFLGYDNSPFADGDMVDWVQSTIGEPEPEDAEETARQVRLVSLALAAEGDSAWAVAEGQTAPTADEIAEGAVILTEEIGCADCHNFHDVDYNTGAPDLTGYMSRGWLIDFIRDPTDERFYPDTNDRMPSFAPHDDPRLNQLDDKSLELVVDWLLGNWYRPAEPAAAE